MQKLKSWSLEDCVINSEEMLLVNINPTILLFFFFSH